VALDTVFNCEVLGDTGASFVASGPRQITRALLQMLEDSDRRSRVASLEKARAATKYSWEGVCAGYERILMSLLEGGDA
jgi:glycosyltransferase involved in cell wall biosynthesis